MGQRTDLQDLLEAITAHVYFQPPSNIKLEFPCIVYKRGDDSVKYAGNKQYLHAWRYEVTVIDRNPDSSLPQMVSELPLCSFDRHFTAENLNHDVFNLFF